MKKLLLIALVYCVCTMQSKAQTWNTSGNAALTSDFLGTTNGKPLYIVAASSTGFPTYPTMKLDVSYNFLMGYNNTLPPPPALPNLPVHDNMLSGYNNSIINMLGDGASMARYCHGIGNNNTFWITQNYLNNSFILGNDNMNKSDKAFLIGNNNTIESAPNSFGIGNNILLNNSAGNVFAIGTGNTGSPLLNTISKSLIVGFNSIPTLFVGPSAPPYIPTSVGIGTTFPVSLLHANGEVSIGSYWSLPPYYGILNINTSSLGQGNGIIIENSALSSKSRINIIAPSAGVKKGGLSLDMTNNGFSNTSNSLFLADDGTVGFGTQNPVSAIHTTGKVYIGNYTQSNSTSYESALNINNANGILIERNDGAWDQIKAKVGISTYSGKSGLRFLMTRDKWTGSSNDPSYGNDALFLAGDGMVGIGTTNPQNKLDVNGTIRATRVLVQALPWPDYVFKTNYSLMTLAEVEKYINQNSHLPEIPSEKEIDEKGLNVGDMQALQMKKIEELTLYIIDLKKEVDALKKLANKE